MSAPALAATLLAGAIGVIRPRPDLEIWEWAEANITLTHKVSAYPGPIRFHRTPYMIGPDSPMHAYRRRVETVVIWPTQVGKTLNLQIIMAYDIAVQPGPGMVVYPDKEVCERRSKKHIRPLLEDCLPGFLTGRADDLTKFQYNLTTCAFFLAWSGSPSVLAAEAIKYLFLDEIAKHVGSRKEDADSVSLAKRRIGSYGQFARIYAATTPKTIDLPGWAEFAKSTQHRFHVRCHECMQPQVMFFGPIDWKIFNPDIDGTPGAPCPSRGGVKWISRSGETIEETAASAYYECQHCGAHWSDAQINDAVAAATAESIADEAANRTRATGWLPTNPNRTRYGSHLVSWAAPWNRLRDVVTRWLESFSDPDKRRDFVNSDLAIPYIAEMPTLADGVIRAHCLPTHKTGDIPPETIALILTIDIMEDHFRYRVRAWAQDQTSWGVEEGQTLPDFRSLDALIAKVYTDDKKRLWHIQCAVIDSGYRTKEVYTWCARWLGRAWPIKGSQSIRDMVHFSNQNVPADPANGLAAPAQITLITYHQDRWRDGMLTRLAVTADSPGAWHLEADISPGFIYQMRGDIKVRTPIKNMPGQFRSEWTTVHANHAFDCEVYSLVAAYVFQVHALRPPHKPPEPVKRPDIIVNPYTGEVIA